VGERAQLARLPGAATALSVARLANELKPSQQTLIIVSANAQEVHQFAQEISWFDPALRVREFSDWETLPYDHFSPHPDLVSDRLQALYALANKACDVLLVAATTATQRLTPRSFIAARTFAFSIR
jgi:transcription-repair coupling factor (superfamily II helicase)